MSGEEVSLVQAAQRLEPEAWNELYNQYYPRIYAFLLTRLRDAMQAEDLAADVFISALRAIRSYEERGLGFSAWLFRVAQNRLTDHLRRSRLRASDNLDDWSERLSDDDAVSGASARADRMDVQRALDRLTVDQRQVIHLRFLDGMTSQEVASVLGKSEASVKITQHRALRAMKQLLSQEPTQS